MADQQDEEPSAPQSIAQRIAALKLNQGSPVPGDPPPSYNQATHSNANSDTSNGIATGTGRPRPPPPPRPTPHGRTVSANVQANGHGNAYVSNLPEGGEPDARDEGVERPPLPARTSTQSSAAAPSLPPRRPSAAPSSGGDSRRASNYSTSQSLSLSRKESNGSISSLATTRSGTSNFSNGERYAVKAPAYDASSLPPLPAKKTEEELREARGRYEGVGALRKGRVGTFGQGLREKKSMPGGLQGKGVGTTPPPPAVPSRPAAREAPSLPQRRETGGEETPKLPDRGPPPSLPDRAAPPTLPKRSSQPETVKSPPPPPAREIAAPPPRKSALTMGMNASTNTTPPVPGRPGSVPQAQMNGGTGGPGAPPPVPKDSRPDLAALQASKPKMNGASIAPAGAPPPPAQNQNACLHCRDFSAPDNHAARFPRESLPSQDLTWLATQLTSPFPSPTDKARALFTWLHHNIAYDTVAFFNHNVQPSTPQSTLNTGLAVCEGYAGLFAALAMKVGLEAYVVGGHGKGFGHTELQPGQPVPPYSAGHAWNVVRIDSGQWKLIDCCWGAGAVNGSNQPYKKRFAPERFTQSNDEFGLDHYPEDSSKQFRSDGRVMGWEEYILGNKNGCGAVFFSGFVAEEGLDKTTFRPVEKKISLSALPGPSVRFHFQKVCPHFDPARHGKGPQLLYVLALDGLEGTKRNHVPFETNGSVWWCDVPVQDLGRPGGKAQIYSVTSFDGGDGRGLTIERYRQRKGRCAFAFGGVCKWEITN